MTDPLVQGPPSPADPLRIEWTLVRDGQQLACHVLRRAQGQYMLRVMYGNVRFLDVRCESLRAALLHSVEMLHTLSDRGWARRSHQS